jgi:hypothetical protein
MSVLSYSTNMSFAQQPSDLWVLAISWLQIYFTHIPCVPQILLSRVEMGGWGELAPFSSYFVWFIIRIFNHPYLRSARSRDCGCQSGPKSDHYCQGKFRMLVLISLVQYVFWFWYCIDNTRNFKKIKIETVFSNIDNKTLHDEYLWHISSCALCWE